MRCPNCKKEIPDASGFCRFCGAKANTSTLINPSKKPKKRTGIIVAISTITVLLLLLIITLVIVLVKKNSVPIIDLNKYLIVDFTGYNGAGKASLSLDWEAINRDHGEEILAAFKKSKVYKKYAKHSEDLNNTIIGGISDYILASHTVDLLENIPLDYRLEPASDLKNGDKTRLHWEINMEQIKEDYNISFQCLEKEYKVEGLKEIEIYDAFKDLEISFYGTAPNGKVDVSRKDNAKYQIDYKVTPLSGLNNGDQVKVELMSNGNVAYGSSFAEQGFKLK